MMTHHSKHKIGLLTILAILSLSTFIPALAYAAPLAVSENDWQHYGGNSWGWNYSPQTQINKNNVDQLEVEWLYPLAGISGAPVGVQSIVAASREGTITPPIVRDGDVFVTTNFLITYSMDAKTGKLNWQHPYVIDIEETRQRLPWGHYSSLTAHTHGFRYWESGDAILLNGMACDFYGLEPKTGEEKFWIKDLCLDVPGNLYIYRPSASDQFDIGTYEKGNQFIFTISASSAHSTYLAGHGRHLTMGIDMDTQQIQWRIFNYPPHGVQSKDWALQECDIGFFQDIPCSDVAAAAPQNLEWDWTFPGEPPSVWGGVTANWGATIVDEDTGMLYTQTGNQGPYTNVSLTPGPRLYGSTIMGIDLDQGKRVWWVQPFPHDPYDYDCNWSGMLVDDPTLGKVYIKGCKEGILYVMDAATGETIHKIDAFNEIFTQGRTTHITDPFSTYDMREWGWPFQDGTYHDQPAIIFPYWSNGAFGTDMAYDGEGTLYYYIIGNQALLLDSPPYIEGQSSSRTQSSPVSNTTIVAMDLATGQTKWTWYYDHSQNRAAMVITGDMVMSPWSDGFMRFHDKDTGQLLYEQNMGSYLAVTATIGKDSDGNSKILVLAGPAGRALNAM